MAVSDLTNTTWYFNPWFRNIPTSSLTYNINFTSNNNSYTSLYLNMINYDDGNYTLNYNSTQVYYCDDDLGEDSWTDETYRTFTITGGTDVTNASLIAFLELNAVQQVDEPDVTYDLTQLDSYLVPGTSYTVTAKAVAAGYADSVASNSVTYVPSEPTPSGYTVTVVGEYYMGNDRPYLYCTINDTPSLSTDYDCCCRMGNIYDSSGTSQSQGMSFTGVTKLYLWDDGGNTWYNVDSGSDIEVTSSSYSSPMEVIINADCTITLVVETD